MGLAQSQKVAKQMHEAALGISIFSTGKPAEKEPFDPEAEPDYSKMQLKPTSHVMARLGRLQKPRL